MVKHSPQILASEEKATTIKLSLIAKRPAFQKIKQKRSYSDYISPCSDLDVEDSKPIFLHGSPTHTRFSYKRLNGSGYTVWPDVC